MGEIPEDVSGAAGSRGNKLGALAGVATGALALLLTLTNTFIGIGAAMLPPLAMLSCCCGFPAITEVVSVGLVVGATFFAGRGVDWSRVPGEDALMFGAMLGARVGAIAGVVGGVLAFVAKLLGIVLSSVFTAMYYGTEILDSVMIAVSSLVMAGVFGAIMGVAFAVGSTIFGAGTGAAVGMMNKQA